MTRAHHLFVSPPAGAQRFRTTIRAKESRPEEQLQDVGGPAPGQNEKIQTGYDSL